MTFFVGVDGGGTSTRAVVLDADGRELGRAKDRGAVVTSAAPQDAAAAVAGVVRAALREAGMDGRASVLWAGLAGAGQDPARAGVTRILEAAGLADLVVVGTDVEAAFHDAFGAGPGVLLIAGTGSIAWARGEDGRIRRVGGWGWRLGDEGSGYAIGMGGLRSVMRAFDGRDVSTSLTYMLTTAVGVPGPEALVQWIETAGKGEIAALAPRVVEAADAGDGSARRIIDEAVAELVQHVRAAAPSEGSSVVLWGGLAADGGPLESRLREALGEVGYVVSERTLDPVRGAARLAIAALD